LETAKKPEIFVATSASSSIQKVPRVESVAEARRELDRKRDLLGDFHPGTVMAMRNLAEVLSHSSAESDVDEAYVLTAQAESAFRMLNTPR